MERKKIIKRVILWILVLAVALTGYLAIQRIRMLNHLTTDLMTRVGTSDTLAGTLTDNIEAFMEDGKTGVVLAYSQANSFYNDWTYLGSICYTYAFSKKTYEHKTKLNYANITIKLDNQGDLQKCIEGSGNISYGFFYLENALYHFIESGETPLNSAEARNYLLGVCEQLKQLDEIQQKYDFTSVPPGSEETVILHLAMYKELFEFSETFKERLFYKPN